ncbi:hypothetical protein [Rhodopirellula sp. MGV]|uniref:hypothetical protein n=1 Tax=Rhodopirellula sp. MGV TaxID=2023130 RepID=UPI000B973039|nr:hypothetical protein [Rhodopirellula sp. MGV]OYP36418.1 hypothetical protein CGZ80_08935 [Rhodopirellula sp. MGV]PNY36845.1 hypothetical protein C2E31_10840 [Rhodopirellula baltica]
MNEINPYASTLFVGDDRTELSFDGEIEAADYIRFSNRRNFERSLCLTLAVLLGTLSAFIVVAMIAGMILRGWDPTFVTVAILAIVLGGAAFWVYRYFVNQTQRSKRLLKRYPDLLGVARGSINADGLTFDDGVRQHWFSPTFLQKAYASAIGIKVPLDVNPYRFLALTDRLFDGYDETVAVRIKQLWSDQSAEVNAAEVNAALWQRLHPAPTDAITFAGEVTVKQSQRIREVLVAAWTNSIGGIGMVVAALVSGAFNTWGNVFFFSVGSFVLISAVISWRQYFFGSSTQTWRQSGWISPTELAVMWGPAGVRMSLNEVTVSTEYEQLLIFTNQTGATYYLAPDHLANQLDWQRLRTRFQTEAVAS